MLQVIVSSRRRQRIIDDTQPASCDRQDDSLKHHKMTTLKHDVFFRNHPVFTGDEFARYLSKRWTRGRENEGIHPRIPHPHGTPAPSKARALCGRTSWREQGFIPHRPLPGRLTTDTRLGVVSSHGAGVPRSGLHHVAADHLPGEEASGTTGVSLPYISGHEIPRCAGPVGQRDVRRTDQWSDPMCRCESPASSGRWWTS